MFPKSFSPPFILRLYQICGTMWFVVAGKKTLRVKLKSCCWKFSWKVIQYGIQIKMINYFIIMVWIFVFLVGGDLEEVVCFTSVHYRDHSTEWINNRNSELPVKASLNRHKLKILMLPQCQQETMLVFMHIKQVRNTIQIRSFADFTWWSSSFPQCSCCSQAALLPPVLQLEMIFYLLCFYKDPCIQTKLHLLSAFNSNSQKENQISKSLCSAEAPFKHLSNSPGVLQFLCPAFTSLAEGQMTTSCHLVTQAML